MTAPPFVISMMTDSHIDLLELYGDMLAYERDAWQEQALALDAPLKTLMAAVEPVLDWFWEHGTGNPDSAALVHQLLDAFNAARALLGGDD